jgi:hypothetical protein
MIMLMKRVMIKATRYHCVDNVPEEVEVGLSLEESKLGPYIQIHGGVTGHESMGLEVIKRVCEAGHWWACAGTRNKYDALKIEYNDLMGGVMEYKRLYG